MQADLGDGAPQLACVAAAGLALLAVRWRRAAGRRDGSRPPVDKADLLAHRAAHTCGAQKLSHPESPLVIVQGQGNCLVDEQGVHYLDSRNNVASIGHQHPRWVAAVTAQLARTNTNARYLHPLREALVGRLLSLSPPHLTHVFLVNSGSEANDLALRLARAKTGSAHVVALEGGYHGISIATLSASPYKWKVGEGPPSLSVLSWPASLKDSPRLNSREDATDSNFDALLGLLELFPGSAFLVESAQSVGGCRLFPQGWLARACELVHERGGVVIADEVQVGLGRIGTSFWAFESNGGCRPDVVTVGKGLGNGFPVAAVLCTAELAQALESEAREVFSTYGGNPVACAAALAVLDVIAEDDLMTNAKEMGLRLMQGCQALVVVQGNDSSNGSSNGNGTVRAVRGSGLFVGIELAETEAERVAKAMLEQHRVLVSLDGPKGNVMVVKPPMTWGPIEVDAFVSALRACV